MKPATKLAGGVVATSFAVAGVILAQGRMRPNNGVADDASWSTDTLGDAYQSACNSWPQVCLDPADCQSDCTGHSPGDLDNCNRVCGGGGAGGLGLVASYVPGPDEGRVQTISSSATPPTIAFYYQESLGHFENRPGGACYTASENATYFKVALIGGTITACRYRASWDTAYYACAPGVIQALNAGASIVVNTDRFIIDPTTCLPRDPLVGHLGFNQVAWLDVELTSGSATTLRRVQFVKNPHTGPHEPPFPPTP
jgi:hypothetical protein